jgi:aryl-alcohol dehydrogenase-like predicted oxidoreductase
MYAESIVTVNNNLVEPMAGGALTGKYRNETSGSSDVAKRLSPQSVRLQDRNVLIADAVDEVAQEIGKSPFQVALKRVRHQNGVIIPLVGASKESQMKENLECLDFTLEKEKLNRLNEVSKIDLGFPHEFLKSEPVKNALYGETYNKIDNYRKR